MRTFLSVTLTVALTALALACGDTELEPIVAANSTNSTATGDAGADGRDESSDATTSRLVTEIGPMEVTIGSLGENCMPSVAPDPVTMQATLEITNSGTSAAGPITITSAAFLDATTLASVATFTPVTASSTSIAAGATVSIDVSKTSGSMIPQSGCDTLACNKEYVVELTLSAPSMTSATIRSVPKATGCTH